MQAVSRNQSYANRMARGSALVFASTFITMALGYFLRLFLTRALTIEEYGLLYAVVTFVNFFALFRDLGLNQALVKFIPEWRVKRQAGKIRSAILWVVKLQTIIAGAAAAIIFLAAPWLAEVYFHTPEASTLIQIMAVAFFVWVFGYIFQSSLQGLQRIKAFSFLQPLNNLFPFVFTVTFVFVGFGLVGAISSYLASAIVFAIISLLLIVRVLPVRERKLERHDKVALTRFALPVMLGFIGGLVLGSTDTIVLTYFRSLTEVGLYQAALPTSMILWSVATAIGIVLFPMVSEMWARKDRKALSIGVSLLLKFSFILVLPFALLMVAWPEFVLSLLFGGAYTAGAAALQILALAAIACTLWQICAVVLSGIGRPGLVTKIMLAAAAFNLVSNIMLVQVFGMVGVAITTLVSFALAFGAAFVVLNKRIGVRFVTPGVLKAIVSGGVMIGLIFAIKSVLVLGVWSEVAISLVAGLAVYSLLVLRLQAISRAELEMLGKLAVPIPRFIFRLARAVAG